jgi:hypothetical protein
MKTQWSNQCLVKFEGWPDRYILLRDRTFLNLLSYTGDRAGDLGTLLTDQIFAIPNNEGIILNLCTELPSKLKLKHIHLLYYGVSLPPINLI